MTLIEFMEMFVLFRAESWAAWRAALAKITTATKEFWAIVGRGAGKSMIVGLVACFFALKEYERAPGESIYVGVFGPDRKQSAITFRYIVGLFRSTPELEQLIVRETADSLELSNGIIVEVITASIAAPRGRSYALAIVEEAAFLRSDESAHPDTEILRAIRPALARVPGSMLAVVSSPYARRGEVFKAWQRYHKETPDHVVFVQGDTLTFNPTFDAAAIGQAYEDDPVAAASEYGGQFRTDVEAFLSLEVVEACVVEGRHELGPVPEHTYVAFFDGAAGGPDSFALAIGHRELSGIVVIDCLREVRPPLNSHAVVAEFSQVCKMYRVHQVTGDKFAGEWPRETFRAHGIDYEVCSKVKSDLYRDALPLLNSRRAELLDNRRLVAQLVALERRVGRSGRDQISHAPSGRDDLANVGAGLLATLGTAPAEAGARRLGAPHVGAGHDEDGAGGSCLACQREGVPDMTVRDFKQSGMYQSWGRFDDDDSLF